MVSARPFAGGISLLAVVYLVIGAVIATQHHFFDNLGTIRLVGSAALGLILWPLILLGVDLHLH
jgi:hypothetical protein